MGETRSKISSRTRFLVLRRDGFRCVYCGLSSAETALHIDHVEPKSKGGEDDLANYVVACAICNGGKATMSVLENASKTTSPQVIVASPALCGKCFVTFNTDGEPRAPGIIRSKITETIYLIQYFELLGDLSTLRLAELKEIADWTLFEDCDHLKFWMEYCSGKKPKAA